MSTTASRAMIATNAVLIVIAGLSVILRLYVRKHQSLPLKTDDYLIVAAWAFSAALAITNILGVPFGGFGVPFVSLSEKRAEGFLKILFVMQFWYIIAVSLVKLSVLFFYGRIFSARRLPIIIRIMVTVTIAWLISFLFATFFQIWPIWCNWVLCKPTTNYPLMYVLCSVTDIVLDISILCLPGFFIKDLQISRGKKVGVAGIFGLGIFCIVASIARLVFSVEFIQEDPLAGFATNFDTAVVNIIMWSGIEACTSTLCANLPCYSPLAAKAAHSLDSFFAGVRSVFSTGAGGSFSRSRSRNRSRSRSSKKKPWQEVTSSSEDINVPVAYVKTVIEGGLKRDSSQELEMGEIRVHTIMQ